MSDQEEVVAAEVERMVDESGSTMGYVGKGHVTKAEMLKGVEWLGLHDASALEHLAINHTYMRKVPNIWDEDSRIGFWFVESSVPGRGAYPATVMYL